MISLTGAKVVRSRNTIQGSKYFVLKLTDGRLLRARFDGHTRMWSSAWLNEGADGTMYTTSILVSFDDHEKIVAAALLYFGGKDDV